MPEPVRIDKWLWAARLVKTRALGAEAVKGGHVELNGQRPKPAKEIRAGDRLELSLGPVRRSLTVLATSERRGPAKEAALLYEETRESIAAREAYAADRRAARPPEPIGGGRPTKRDRRRFEATRRGRS